MPPSHSDLAPAYNSEFEQEMIYACHLEYETKQSNKTVAIYTSNGFICVVKVILKE